MDNFDKTLDRQVSELLHKAGEFAQNHARHTNLFKHGSNFDNSIFTYQIGKTQQIVISTAPYSSYLEVGNNQFGPKIYPKKGKKALRWFVNGEPVYRAWVRTHGPLPFMEEAKEATQNAIPELWKKIK